MKNLKYLLSYCLMLFSFSTNAQTLNLIKNDADALISSTNQKKVLAFKEHHIRGSYPVSIAFYKTTHIVFESPIKYFDAGSNRIICDRVEGVDNVLKLKAAQIGIFETNVTVITHDGKYYSFLVSYNESPNKLNITMAAGLNDDFEQQVSDRPEKIVFSDTYYTETEMIHFSKKMIELSNTSKHKIQHIADKIGKVQFKLIQLATKEGKIILCISMKNSSPLDYGLEYMKFYVRDKTKRKKEVSQEIELKPNFVYVEQEGIPDGRKLGDADASFNFVFMMPKFSIGKDKHFEIDIVERDGSRNMNLKVDYETFYYQMNKL
ncbi:conjugative transposon protein TraN [Arcicella sp. DC2W]|uniref:Conjugative transposon protein TraN n=1 Tax=Arcicella gelida TaxID=2984195 RepID=A0ABU5S3K4_9BACT|nr:conjugative transposon protein TraN [Arcicella sp. DC2W]MEA5402969.1 conjugative transposon protein TraN [Arcicella sp. DC2W]